MEWSKRKTRKKRGGIPREETWRREPQEGEPPTKDNIGYFYDCRGENNSKYREHGIIIGDRDGNELMQPHTLKIARMEDSQFYDPQLILVNMALPEGQRGLRWFHRRAQDLCNRGYKPLKRNDAKTGAGRKKKTRRKKRRKNTRKKRGGMSLENDCPICLNPLTTDGTANTINPNNRPVNVHAAPLPLNQPIPAGYYDADGAKHFFHENCIGNWTQNTKCPMCQEHMIIRGPAPQQMIVDDDSEEEDGFQEPACDGCPQFISTNDVRTSDDWRNVEGYGHLQGNGNYCNNCVENWICTACNEIIHHSYRYRPDDTFREQCPWCEAGQTYTQWAPENDPNWSSSGEDSDVEHIDFLQGSDNANNPEDDWAEASDYNSDEDHAAMQDAMGYIDQGGDMGGGKRRKKKTRKKRGGSGSESKKNKTDWRERIKRTAKSIGDRSESLDKKIQKLRISPITVQPRPLTKTDAEFEHMMNKFPTKDSNGGRRKKKKRKKTKKKALRRRRKRKKRTRR